ncbi:hypothetical protein ABMA27_003286 [Loxostege sticticalis]|uniref:Uncharacterized protein n=1 Tax=Loxostege sticticalis TaxID=481309 RepID=A0ABR3HSK6_LOXSC
MRYNIFLLVLVLGLCYSVLGQDANGDQNADDSSSTNDSDNSDGRSKSEDDIYNICENTEKKACVKNFFRTSFQCFVARFDDRQPVYRKRQTAYVPSVNLTLITTRDVITFSGSEIKNFYMNSKTNNLVMTVSFESIRIESGFTYYVISQRGQEPVIVGDSVNVTYTPTLTAIIPIINYKIDMKSASVHAYLYDASPKYEIGPGIAESSNPVVKKTVEALLSNLPTVLQEVFLTEAKSFFLSYFQSQICIFGVPLYTRIQPY